MEETRIQELFYDLYYSSKQHDSWQRYAMIRELRELMKQPKGGSDHFERFGDDRRIDGDDRRFGVGQFRDGADDDEEQSLVMDEELAEMEDRAVENETNTKMISAIDKDESMPQSKVPVSDSENFRSKELGKSDLELEKLDHVVMNENLELEWDQVSVNGKLEVVGEVERDQKLISDANTCCAHKVFVKIPRKEKRIKHLKGWKFKFKPTSKTSRSMDVKHFYVEEIALLNKDPKETIWDGVKKEFKETMAACGMKRVDRFKLVDEKESRLEVLDLNQTFMYHQIGHGVDMLLAFKMLDHDKEQRLSTQAKLFKHWKFKRKSLNNRRRLHRHIVYFLALRVEGTASSSVWHRWRYKLVITGTLRGLRNEEVFELNERLVTSLVWQCEDYLEAPLDILFSC